MKYFLQEQAAKCDSTAEKGETSGRRGMVQGEPRLGEEGQGFNRTDAMKSLESKVNQELDAR